ncbi:MAG: hypothetical protein LBK95_16770 [Bifidobacteriaceae bacterium]|nr:hypothetical protein [Bifidobacteriaceae bacterium]
MKRRGQMVAALAALVGSLTAGCTWSIPQDQLRSDIEDVTEAEVADLTLGNPRLGEGPVLSLTPPNRQVSLSTADLVAAIVVLDRYRSEYPAMRDAGAWVIACGDQEVGVGWSRKTDARPSMVEEITGGATGPYDDSYCEFPDLKRLGIEGAGGNFTRIGECNPALELLRIYSWDGMTDFGGLADLGHLRKLFILGTVDEPSVFPRIGSLEYLQVRLAEDTTANREALQARLPECEIQFTDEAGSVVQYPPDSDR